MASIDKSLGWDFDVLAILTEFLTLSPPRLRREVDQKRRFRLHSFMNLRQRFDFSCGYILSVHLFVFGTLVSFNRSLQIAHD